MARWYYKRDEQEYGPVSFEQLKQLAAAGQLGPADHWADWRKMFRLFVGLTRKDQI